MSVAQTLFVRFVLIALSLGSAIVCARTLGPAGRGEQGAIGLWPMLVAGLSTLGLPAAAAYHTSRATNEGGSLLSAASLTAIIASSAAAAVGTIAVPHLLTPYSTATIRSAQLLMCFAPALSLSYVLRGYFEGRGEFLRSNISRLWPPACSFVLVAAFWRSHALTPLSANLAVFVPSFIQCVWLSTSLWGRLEFNMAALRMSFAKLLSYGLQTYATDIMNTLSVQVDQAVIISYLSPSELGLYTIALTAARTLNVFQASLNTVLFPMASGMSFDDALELVGRLARISNLISGIGTLFFMAIVPVVIPLFYGVEFDAASDITRALTVEAFLAGVASVLAQGFLATGRPSVVTMLQGAWVVTSLIFLTILVPRVGIMGAAIALVASSFVRVLATLLCYPIILHRPIPHGVPGVADIRYLSSKLATLGA